MICQMKGPDKITRCPNPATHVWGPEDESTEGYRVYFCCEHFSRFVAAMFTAHDIATIKKHYEFVQMYEERTKRTSRLIGAMCQDAEATRKDEP